MINEEVDKACGLLVSSIITSPDVDTNVAAEIDRKKNILANDIKNLLKESFGEIGNIMKENFSIPANVTLSTDQNQLKCMNTNEEQLQGHYDELLQRFMAVSRISFKCCVLFNELRNAISRFFIMNLPMYRLYHIFSITICL